MNRFIPKYVGKGKLSSYKKQTKTLGFSLIELIVVVTVLATLITVFYYTLDPVYQLNKAYDTQRIKDLSTIATALDTYYNDHGVYPQKISFGQKWADSSTDYMEKVPNDPQFETNGNYCYMSDNSTTPQWNILFSKLVNKSISKKCELADICLPIGYSQQWVCKVSGKVDCSALSKYSLPCTSPTPSPAPTFIPTISPTPDLRYAGVCELRDDFTNSPNATSPDVANGYAKLAKPGNYTAAQLRVACNNQQDFQALMTEYCNTNKYPAQYEVEEFSNGQRIGVSWDSPYSTGCVVNTPIGCCDHSCSSGFPCTPNPLTPYP